MPLTRVRIRPSAGAGAKLVGAKIQGSSEGETSGFVDLATVASAPVDGQFTELTLQNDKLHRYVRFFDPQARRAGIAEIEFYHGPALLRGRAFGTAGEGSVDHPFSHALDAKPDTYFEATTSGGNYVGLDIAGSYVAATPTFDPAPGALTAPASIVLGSSTPGATVRYTTDGSSPSADSGMLYGQPFRFESGRLSVRAQAYASCYFPSEVASASYGIGVPAATQGQKSYHLGNSLTDMLNRWLEQVADSTGVDHSYARLTMPGSPVGWLWEHRDDGIGTPPEAARFDTFVRTFAPIGHLSVQPFADPVLETQGGAAVKIFQAAQQHSPDLQPWIYAQWANQFPNSDDGGGYLQDGFARGANHANWPAPATPVPNTWEDTTVAQMRFHEAFRSYVDERIPGKKVLVCPAGLALVELKKRMDAGGIPGMSDFFGTVFQDYLHLNPPGQYLVSLAFYSCMYRRTPEGHVTVKPDGMTQEQAKLLQQIAWEVTSRYPLSGITE